MRGFADTMKFFSLILGLIIFVSGMYFSYHSGIQEMLYSVSPNFYPSLSIITFLVSIIISLFVITYGIELNKRKNEVR